MNKDSSESASFLALFHNFQILFILGRECLYISLKEGKETDKMILCLGETQCSVALLSRGSQSFLCAGDFASTQWLKFAN